MKTTHLSLLSLSPRWIAVSLALGLSQLTAPSLWAVDAGDDFDAATVDTNKWGPDFLLGNGVLAQANERLEFTLAKPSKYDLTTRPWVMTQMPMTNDWDVQVILHNTGNFLKTKQYTSMGLEVRNWVDPYDYLYTELYATSFGGLPAGRGFYLSLGTDGTEVGSADSYNQIGALPTVEGAVRISFDSGSQMLSAYYDTNTVDGLQWIALGSIGINATQWGMSNTDRFSVVLYGYGEKTICVSGEMFAEDFASVGGVGYVIPPTRLTAAFSKVSEKCKEGETVSCKLKGGLAMTNGTTSAVDETRVRVYLSANSTFEDGVDELLGTYQTGFLKPGKAKKLKVSATRSTNDAGSFLLAVADNGEVLATFQLPVAAP